MIVNAQCGLIQKAPNLRYVPYCCVDWSQYDIIKTLFHKGFESLCSEEQDNHPFIISKLGSVFGNHDDTEGVHFSNGERADLLKPQRGSVRLGQIFLDRFVRPDQSDLTRARRRRERCIATAGPSAQERLKILRESYLNR
jgi:hypothetical protein